MECLTKITEYYLGCDRDNGIHSTIEFYKNPGGLILFRYFNQIWHGHGTKKSWEERFSDFQHYRGKMTLQEIIDHPEWAINLEEQAIKARPCKMDLEKIAETQVRKFKAFAGTTLEKTEYFECDCCKQVYCRNMWHLEETGICTIDSGYQPEIKLTKEEIIANAPDYCGSMISIYNKRKI